MKPQGDSFAEKMGLALDSLFKFLASLKLAVIVILGIAIMSAIGTFVEAKYGDAEIAQKLVYHSPYMYGILGLLIINLINVMVDRWPWKPHHAGFVLAHIGIIILLLGSLVTRYYGIDGSMSFEIGKSQRFVTLPEKDLAIYSSFGDGKYSKMHKQMVDFIVRPPDEATYQYDLGDKSVKVKNYIHFGRQRKTG